MRVAFSLAKKYAGAYFNNGEYSASCQNQSGNPSEKMEVAVDGSREVFFALYLKEGRNPKLIKRLENVISALKRDSVKPKKATA